MKSLIWSKTSNKINRQVEAGPVGCSEAEATEDEVGPGVAEDVAEVGEEEAEHIDSHRGSQRLGEDAEVHHKRRARFTNIADN